MSADETTRLRALLEGIALPWRAQPTIVDGDEVECLALVLCPYGDDGDSTTLAEIDMGYDIECNDAHAALIVAAVNALPGLLDAAERAERAERERGDIAATLETRTAELARAMERVRELLAACEAFSGPDGGVLFDGRDYLCGGCGGYRGDDMDPASHDSGCPRLAARQLAARIRDGVGP